jgi:hypothetical protein
MPSSGLGVSMIKLTLHNRLCTIVNPKYIVYAVADKLGTQVVTTNGTLGVVESVDDVMKLWHDFCTINSTINSTNNSTNIVEEKNTTHNNTNTNSTNSNNSGGGVGNGKILLLNNMPVPVDQSVKPDLWSYCNGNEQLIDVFSYWMTLYENHGGQYNLVSSIDLGTMARVVRTGASDKAKDVFDWVFTSDHYRAKYLRNNGMVNPAVLVSSTKLDSNYALSQVKPLPPLAKSVKTKTSQSDIPMFDADGNIIGG